MLSWQILSLFFVAFSAATLLPGGSEALLAGLVAQGDHSLWLLVGVATIGNVLGSIVNYGLGRLAYRYRTARWFPVSQPQLEKAQGHFEKWGQWSLLFAWLPLVGDPITVIAGLLRSPFWSFCLLVFIGKCLRYLAVVGLLEGILAWVS